LISLVFRSRSCNFRGRFKGTVGLCCLIDLLLWTCRHTPLHVSCYSIIPFNSCSVVAAFGFTLSVFSHSQVSECLSDAALPRVYNVPMSLLLPPIIYPFFQPFFSIIT